MSANRKDLVLYFDQHGIILLAPDYGEPCATLRVSLPGERPVEVKLYSERARALAAAIVEGAEQAERLREAARAAEQKGDW